MATTEWSASFEASPSDADSRKQGDDRFRELKLSIRERAVAGGHFMQDSVAPFLKDGKHVRGIGASGGPWWFKSDGTTVEMDMTSDTVVHIADDLNVDGVLTAKGTLTVDAAGDTNFAATPLSTNEIAANAITANYHWSSLLTDTVPASSTKTYATGTLTNGSPRGPVLIMASAQIEGVAVDHFVSVYIEIDYTNSGTFVAPFIYQNPSNLYVPLRTAANATNMLFTTHTIDPMSTSADGGSYKWRLGIYNGGTGDLIVRGAWLDSIEFRR